MSTYLEELAVRFVERDGLSLDDQQKIAADAADCKAAHLPRALSPQLCGHGMGIDSHNRCLGPRKARVSPGSNSTHLGQVNTSLDCLWRWRAAFRLCREEQGEECERLVEPYTLVHVVNTDIFTGLKYLAMTLTALPKEFLQSTHSKPALSCVFCCSHRF